MRLVPLVLVALSLMSGASHAEQISGQAARAELFDTCGIGLQLAGCLSD